MVSISVLGVLGSFQEPQIVFRGVPGSQKGVSLGPRTFLSRGPPCTSQGLKHKTPKFWPREFDSLLFCLLVILQNSLEVVMKIMKCAFCN